MVLMTMAREPLPPPHRKAPDDNRRPGRRPRRRHLPARLVERVRLIVPPLWSFVCVRLIVQRENRFCHEGKSHRTAEHRSITTGPVSHHLLRSQRVARMNAVRTATATASTPETADNNWTLSAD